jgi:hypothetical protein
MKTGTGEKLRALRALWLRLKGRDPSANAELHVERAQRTILFTLDGWERAVARSMRRAHEAEMTILSSRIAPRQAERFEALCEQLRQDVAWLRRAPLPRGEARPPEDPDTTEARRREAMACLGTLDRDLDALEKRCTHEQTWADEWRRRAQLAVKAGDDNLAREALARARAAAETGSGLRRELEVGRRVTAELRAALVTSGSDTHPPS